MNRNMDNRSGARVFSQLLLKGQRVDWRHSLVVVLVITGMFATPLALGSIRNRVYVAVRDQIEKENNAREIAIQVSRDEAPPLDDRLITEIEEIHPGVRAVGNHELVVSVEGPEASDFLTLQTLAPGDPRQASLQIDPAVPEEFGLDHLVVSDSLGRLLYGEDWDVDWQDGRFDGPPLKLAIHDLSLARELRVVARRQLPGRGLYASSALGAALRRYTEGLGAPELGLPADPGLLEHALPSLASTSCLLLLDTADPTCDVEAQERLRRRLAQLHYEVREAEPAASPRFDGHRLLGVELAEMVEQGEAMVRREVRSDCRETLAPHLVETCAAASVLPELGLEVVLARGDGELTPIALVAAERGLWELLPGSEELTDRHGSAAGSPDGNLGLAAPDGSLEVGEAVDLGVAGTWVPARVERLYACPDGSSCPLYAEPLHTYRLRNLADGLVRLSTRQPLVFVPVEGGIEYDEVLAYVPRVEDVEAVSLALRERYPGYDVQYNVAAIAKLERQDARLSTLFTLTISLSALFIVLALGALARINVERRRRQMAQMLILGFSRRFVRRLIVSEYLLLTAAAAGGAFTLTALLCAAARRLLSTSTGGEGFEVIVQSMGVDPAAFVQVLAVVALCTWTVAVLSAHTAARTDPLNLLD